MPQRKWKYDNSLANESAYYSELNNKQIGQLLKEHFIKLKRSNMKSTTYDKNDISCIGNKGEIASKLIATMADINLTFKELPVLAQEMTKNIYIFIKSKNS